MARLESFSSQSRLRARLMRRTRGSRTRLVGQNDERLPAVDEQICRWLGEVAPDRRDVVILAVVAAAKPALDAAATVDDLTERALRAAFDALATGNDSAALARLLQLELGGELAHFARIRLGPSQTSPATLIAEVAHAAIAQAASVPVREVRFATTAAALARSAMLAHPRASGPDGELHPDESPWTALTEEQRDVCSLALACRLSATEVHLVTGRSVGDVRAILAESWARFRVQARSRAPQRSVVDAAIATGLCAGHQREAIELATERFGPKLRGHLRVSAGTQADGDDLAQEVWQIASAKLPSVLPWSTYSWLYGVGHRALKRWASRYSRGRRVSLDTGAAVGLVASTHSSNARYERRRGEVASRLTSLTPLERSVFLMRVERGFSNAEVAELLGTSEGAVRVRMAKAKKKVQAAIEEASAS